MQLSGTSICGTANSKLINTQVQRTWDFFAYAPVQAGDGYVLIYKPHRDEAQTYREGFKTEPSGNGMARINLDKAE